MRIGLIGIILAMVLISTASAINVAMSSDSGSTSDEFNAGLLDHVMVRTVVSQNSIDNSITGSGSFRDKHTSANDAGATEVLVNISGSRLYSYSYYLNPSGSYALTAREMLNVSEAKEIKAHAEARTSDGRSAKSEISIRDGSLYDYSNSAYLSGKEIATAQGFTKAEGNYVGTKTSASLGSIQSIAYTSLNSGALNGYTDTVNIKRDLNEIEVNQKSHIHLYVSPSIGSFLSDGYTHNEDGNREVHRSSNYGTEYDQGLNLRSGRRAQDNLAAGLLTYYVDANNRYADKIHGAIDAYSTGDLIKVAPGTYKENLYINKVTDIRGSGADKTIVDGQKTGSAIKIEKDGDAYLEGLTLRNGNADEGAGVNNQGRLTINDSVIESNEARRTGGGIYNNGILTLKDVNISSNHAEKGGGVYNNANFSITVYG